MKKNHSTVTRILQVGDVHLPTWPDRDVPIDLKDQGFSKEIVSDLSHNELSNILKAVNRIACSAEIDAVLFMGDFTTKGDSDQIPHAIKILTNLMRDDEL